MARVLVFNLSTKFDLARFARTEAVDLYRSDSQVSMFDATDGVREKFGELWGPWPKKMDARPKSIADEILDHVRAARDYKDQVIAFYIVDDALSLLPPIAEGSTTPTAQAAVELVERVLQYNQDIHNTRVVQLGICLSGHLIEKQREAVTTYFESGLSNIEGLFFFEGLFQNRGRLPELGTRFLIDVMMQRGSDDDGIRSLENRSDFAFVVKFDDGVATISAAMRQDFCSFVQQKIDSGFDEQAEAARNSEDYKKLKDIIWSSNATMTSIEAQMPEPIEVDFGGPMRKAPSYKTAALLAEIDKRAHRFEDELRSAAQERIESEVSLSKISEVEGLRVEQELKNAMNDIELPPMQFRTSLLNVIRSDLYPELNKQLVTAESAVTELRRNLAGFFSHSNTVDGETKPKRQALKYGPQDVDLSQLQNVVSSEPYWDAHTRFLKAAKRLPSRSFAYAVCLLPFVAMWMMAYAFLYGLFPDPVPNYLWWHHLALLVPEGQSSEPTYHQPIIIFAVWVAMLLGVNWVFFKIRRRVRVAHGNYIIRAQKLETDFRNLAQMAEAYRKRARVLQMRKAFMVRLDENLNEKKVDLFNQAVRLLELRRNEEDELVKIPDQSERFRARNILADEKKSLGWIDQYFSEATEFVPASVEIKLSDTTIPIEVQRSPFLAQTVVNFDDLRGWKR